MSVQRTLKVTDRVYSDFSALKIRIAVSRDNRIPSVSNMIQGMIVLANRHYEELLTELAGKPEQSES